MHGVFCQGQGQGVFPMTGFLQRMVEGNVTSAE